MERPEDAWFDDFGNLTWVLMDREDGIPDAEKTVVYFDGHTDTVWPLRDRWHEATGGLDPFDGLVDESKLNREFLRAELGFLPPDDEWHHLVWGRGAADQLSGVVSQVVASKVLRRPSPSGPCAASSSAATRPWPRRTTTAAA